jgi:phage/plasmid-like protein (TIGR03299 family)
MHEVETMFSGRGVTPWHKLGKVVAGCPTSAEAIKLAGLDWRVRAEDLQIESPEWRSSAKIPARAIVRETDGSVLGVVGTSYRVFQNGDAFDIGDDLTPLGARWESAGSLQSGARVWALMRMRPDDRGEEIAPGDVVKPFLLISSSHDGSAAVSVMLTSVRVVCMNTLRMALGGARSSNSISVRHTGAVKDRVAEAAKIIRTAEDIRARWTEAARKMAARRVSTFEARDLAYSALDIEPDPTKRSGVTRAKVHEIDYRLQGRNNAPGTLWGAVNAVTEFTSHSKRGGRSTGMERLLSTVDGSADAANQRMWNAALALV